MGADADTLTIDVRGAGCSFAGTICRTTWKKKGHRHDSPRRRLYDAGIPAL